MAADLGLSQRTIEIDRARVMEKMGASSVAQLVRMMMDLHDDQAQREPDDTPSACARGWCE